MSFPAALNLLKRDCEKKAIEMPTYPLLRDSLSVTPLHERDALYTFIDKETIPTRNGSSRVIHRLYVYVPNCDSKCVGWVLNDDVDNCMVCNRSFGMFLWKKHCRCCGNVICGNCVVDDELIIIELSDLGEQLLCVQCYYGQDEVHAQCYIVGKNGLDKTYYPPPPVRRMNTGELSRRGTGELSRGGTNNDVFSNASDFSPGSMRVNSPGGGQQTRGASKYIGTGAVRGGYDSYVKERESVANTVAPSAGFIIKTRVVQVDTDKDSRNHLNVYINVTYHESIPRTSSTATVEAGSSAHDQYHPCIISTYKQYVRQTSSDKSQKFIIFNVAVNPLHVLPLLQRTKTDTPSSGGKKIDEKGAEMLSRYERLCLYLLKSIETSFDNLLLSREISFPLINELRNFIGPRGEKVRFKTSLVNSPSPRPLLPLGEGDSQNGSIGSPAPAIWYNNHTAAVAVSESGSLRSTLVGSDAGSDIRVTMTVLVLNEAIKPSEAKEQIDSCRELVVILLPGTVMKSCCNRKDAEITDGFVAATPQPDLFSPFSSPLASPTKPNKNREQSGFASSFPTDALYQHRVFVNICHNRHLPVAVHSNSTRYVKKGIGNGADNTIAIDHILKLIKDSDLFMLCNAPKLGTPSASAKESKDRTISRDFIIYDVVVCSVVFEAMKPFFAEFSPPETRDSDAEQDETSLLAQQFTEKKTSISTYILGHICDKYGDTFNPSCSFPKTKNQYKGNASDILPYIMKGTELDSMKESVASNCRPIVMAAIPAFVSKPKALPQREPTPELASMSAGAEDGGDVPAEAATEENVSVINTAVVPGEAEGDGATTCDSAVIKKTPSELTLAPDVTDELATSSPSIPPGSIKISKEKSNEIRALLLKGSPVPSPSSTSSSMQGRPSLTRHGSDKTMLSAQSGEKEKEKDRVVLRRQSTRMASKDNPLNSIAAMAAAGSPTASDPPFGSPSSLGTSYIDAAVQDWLDLSDEYGGYNFATKTAPQSALVQGQKYRGLSLHDSVPHPHEPAAHTHQASQLSKDDTISTIKDNLKNNRTFILAGDGDGDGAGRTQGDAYVNPSGDIIYSHTTPWEMFMKDGEKLVATGLIGKRNKVGIIKQRQLILTDYPRLFYVDPKTMTIRGEVEWSDEDPPYALEVNIYTLGRCCQ